MSSSVVPVTKPRGELSNLLTVSYPDVSLTTLFARRTRKSSSAVLIEQRQRDVLARHGLRPMRRILLIGPGTGIFHRKGYRRRTSVATFCDSPRYLITNYGETASKLRLVFDALAETRGVYLLTRWTRLLETARGNDVGEIRRVLNSFLQFLEEIRRIASWSRRRPSETFRQRALSPFRCRHGIDLPDDATIRAVIAIA